MDSRHVLAVNVPAVFYGKTKPASCSIFTRKSYVASMRFRASIKPLLGWSLPGAMSAPVPLCNSVPLVTFTVQASKIRERNIE